MTTELEIMDELMNAVTQTDEWKRIQLQDARILEAERELYGVLEQVRQYIPAHLMAELEDAMCGAVPAAYGDVGILYGIQVADAIHAVAAKPTLLSRHIMERVAAMRTAG